MIARDAVLYDLTADIRPYLEEPDVTEVSINGPGELWTVRPGGRQRHLAPGLTLDKLEHIARALAAYNTDSPRNTMSVKVPGGYRGHVVRPPVVDEGFVIVIRKHIVLSKSLADLDREGAFSQTRLVSSCKGSPERAIDRHLLSLANAGNWSEFCRLAVLERKNIVVSGKTGSGKTTFIRALIGEIPVTTRIVTIEDTHELHLPDHPDKVHLLYGTGAGKISATEALAVCMRLSPDRIFLSEMRGAEAFPYLSSCNTGHPGGITTAHANSAELTIDRVTELAMQDSVARVYGLDALTRIIRRTLDVILYMADRKVLEVLFEPAIARG